VEPLLLAATVVQVLRHLFLALLLVTLVVVVAHNLVELQWAWVVLVGAAWEAAQVRVLLEQPIQAVEVVGAVALLVDTMAVQALSFFATPAQFNISLVAQ
jgi:hypothetical protein